MMALLAEEASVLGQFVETLQREQAALVGGELDRLLSLAEEKSEFAGRLANLSELRLRAIQTAGGPADPQNLSRWLEAQADPHVAATWRSLLDLARQARELNTTSGKLIAERMRHNQQALAVLLQAGERAALYGPDGQPRLAGGGRPLGSA